MVGDVAIYARMRNVKQLEQRVSAIERLQYTRMCDVNEVDRKLVVATYTRMRKYNVKYI